MKPDVVTLEKRPVRRAVWNILWPLREYVRRAPMRFGKGFLVHRILEPIINVAPDEIRINLPGDLKFQVPYGQVLTREILVEGDFESEERKTLSKALRPGSIAFDVGANIGIFAIALAKTVGPEGMIIAVEPVPMNVEGLMTNALLNGLSNVEVLQLAASDRDAEVSFTLAGDPAYHSMHGLPSHVTEEGTIKVRTTTLDRVWESHGKPRVSAIKIDVERGELQVIQGALQMLAACLPVLLIELQNADQRNALQSLIGKYGYEISQPEGFMPWNFICEARPPH